MIKLRQDIIFPSQFYKEPTLQGMKNCEKQTVKKNMKTILSLQLLNFFQHSNE